MAIQAQLPTRQLGKNGPQVPAPGWGLMELSVGYGAKPMFVEVDIGELLSM